MGRAGHTLLPETKLRTGFVGLQGEHAEVIYSKEYWGTRGHPMFLVYSGELSIHTMVRSAEASSCTQLCRVQLVTATYQVLG